MVLEGRGPGSMSSAEICHCGNVIKQRMNKQGTEMTCRCPYYLLPSLLIDCFWCSPDQLQLPGWHSPLLLFLDGVPAETSHSRDSLTHFLQGNFPISCTQHTLYSVRSDALSTQNISSDCGLIIPFLWVRSILELIWLPMYWGIYLWIF